MFAPWSSASVKVPKPKTLHSWLKWNDIFNLISAMVSPLHIFNLNTCICFFLFHFHFHGHVKNTHTSYFESHDTYRNNIQFLQIGSASYKSCSWVLCHTSSYTSISWQSETHVSLLWTWIHLVSIKIEK